MRNPDSNRVMPVILCICAALFTVSSVSLAEDKAAGSISSEHIDGIEYLSGASKTDTDTNAKKAIKGFHHVGLHVRDIERSLSFYVNGLGGKITIRIPVGDRTVYFVDLGDNATVELSPYASKPPIASRGDHMAISTDDVDAAYELTMRAGASSCDVPQDFVSGDVSLRLAKVYGPDNEIIEFVKFYP